MHTSDQMLSTQHPVCREITSSKVHCIILRNCKKLSFSFLQHRSPSLTLKQTSVYSCVVSTLLHQFLPEQCLPRLSRNNTDLRAEEKWLEAGGVPCGCRGYLCLCPRPDWESVQRFPHITLIKNTQWIFLTFMANN